jgi:hypothetical protein
LHHRVFSIVRRACCACLAVVVAATPFPLRAAEQENQAAASGSAAELRQDALRILPLSKLTPSGRAVSNRILQDVTVFRRMPTEVVECDAELFGFLVEHPDVVINIWEVLGVTKVTLKRLSDYAYHLDDGNGTTGDARFLYRSPTQYVIYCEGTYTGSMVTRPIRGRCLLSLRTIPVEDVDGRAYVQCRMDSFVQIDNLGAEMFAKTFQSMLGNIADHNFRETTGFVAKVSEAAEESPGNIHRLAAKLNRISPQTKQQFVAIGDRIGAEALGIERTAQRTSQGKK